MAYILVKNSTFNKSFFALLIYYLFWHNVTKSMFKVRLNLNPINFPKFINVTPYEKD